MILTVFTPIYNRADFLNDIYKSLKEQSVKDFEWLIVDDGSSDNCENVLSDIVSKHNDSFRIRFYKKPNGGKHTAINIGVREAEGELFLILDSDDSLPPNSISTIIHEYKDISKDNSICGVSGLMAHHDGTLIGSGYPVNGLIASSLDLRYKYNVTGDLIEVFKTKVLREYPFPEIQGERFCPEALVWNRIARKYKLKCFNEVVYYRDYLDGGLTDNIVKIRMKSPIASMMCYSELNKLKIPFKQKLKAAINYWRFRFCLNARHNLSYISFIWIWVIPFSYLMHLNDLKTIKRND